MKYLLEPLVFLIMFGLFYLLNSLFPNPPEEKRESDLPIVELDAKYTGWEWQSVPLIFPFWFFFSACWFGLFWLLRIAWHPAIAADELYLPAHPIAFLLPATGLGIITAVYAVSAYFSWRLGDQYEEFKRYSNDPRRTLRINPYFAYTIMYLMIIASVVGGLMVVDCYTRVTSKSFVFNGAFGIGEVEHPLTEIVALRRIDGYRDRFGEYLERPWYEVEFRDGYTWSTNWAAVPHRDFEQEGGLMKRLQRSTRLTLKRFHEPPDEPGSGAIESP